MENKNIYLFRMQSALKEKLFFTEFINLKDYSLIVDFGCANGVLLNQLVCDNKEALRETLLVGYDNNSDFINLAISQNRFGGFIRFTKKFETIKTVLQETSGKSLIIFSSVLHELSEAQQNQAIELMKQFDAVVIRDMKRPTNNEPISHRTRARIKKFSDPVLFKDFEAHWGRITDKYGLYHYFLKNEFVENWETEVLEDYFSVPWSDITWGLQDTHSVIYEHKFCLPYRKMQVYKKFKHIMHDITHKEIIFVRNKANEV